MLASDARTVQASGEPPHRLYYDCGSRSAAEERYRQDPYDDVLSNELGALFELCEGESVSEHADLSRALAAGRASV